MRTHVFIVNDSTFHSHLRYLFAGTTGGDERDEFIGLLADINRVRPGDLVVFYIEGTTLQKGGFYGVFQIADDTPVVFKASGPSAYQPNLGRKLIYRTLLKPYEVYAQGVPEWEALDKLPDRASEVQWSLIYRKLKAHRGCTPLLPWEGDRLIEMIRAKNTGRPIARQGDTCGFDWDPTGRRIVGTDALSPYRHPTPPTTDLLEAIHEQVRRRRAFEVHLQAYLTGTIGIRTDLAPIVGDNPMWFGNEVACSVGMQKIDILTLCEHGGRRQYRLIELKHKPVESWIVVQIENYVNWASQAAGRHLEAAFPENLQTVIVAPRHRARNWQAVVDAFEGDNRNGISLPILYFEFAVGREPSISFTRINY